MAVQDEQSISIPNTNVWDTETEHLATMDVTKPEFKELLVRLFQDLNRMALSVNGRDAGIYNVLPFVNSQVWFPNPGCKTTSTNFRSAYRKVINFGALPAAGNTAKAHNIPCNTVTSFTRIYGVATNPVAPFSYIPLPFVDVSGANIELIVDGTNVNIDVGVTDRSAYTICYIVLEYLKY